MKQNFVRLILCLTLVIGLIPVALVGAASLPVSVSYRTHVQNIGWQNSVSDGAMSGTSGQSLRLEGIEIKVSGNSNLGISYSTHVQNIGWQGFVSDGAMSGTSGQSLRLEAIKIQLTGTDAALYDVYYHVHAQNFGWMGWAKNGESAGTAGYAYRLEAIEIVIIPAGATAPGITSGAFAQFSGVSYTSHVQNIGWQDYVSNGELSGTSGLSYRLEALKIKLANTDGGIEYRTHVQDYGWMNWVSNDALSGTSGQAKRLESIEIRLTGAATTNYDVYYRVHAQNFGWMGWAKNGASAGTAGYGYRLEAIQIVLVPKGGAAPGTAEGAFAQYITPDIITPTISLYTPDTPIPVSNYSATGKITSISYRIYNYPSASSTTQRIDMNTSGDCTYTRSKSEFVAFYAKLLNSAGQVVDSIVCMSPQLSSGQSWTNVIDSFYNVAPGTYTIQISNP